MEDNDEKARRMGSIIGFGFLTLAVAAIVFGVLMEVTVDYRTEIQRYEYTEIDRMVREFPQLSEMVRDSIRNGRVVKSDFTKLNKQYEQLQFEKQKKELFQKLEVNK